MYALTIDNPEIAKPAKEVLTKNLFQSTMLSTLEESQTFIGRFQPRGAELAELCKKGADLMLEATQEELKHFAES